MTIVDDEAIAQIRKGLALLAEPTRSAHTAAFAAFTTAAATGHNHAKYHLAAALLRGRGCTRDEARAEELLREAAIAGDLSALVTLAARRGDREFAAKVYAFAADRGHPIALFNLGLCHIDGVGVPRDLDKGVQLCVRAAHWGDNNARYQLARWLLVGDFVVRDEPRAIELLNQAADEGHLGAMALVARCAIMGRAGDRDNAVGLRRLREGAARDDARCAFLLGLYYANGLLDSVTNDSSCEWLEKASSLGCGDADFHLGLLYLRGTGVLKNFKKATDCFHQALNRGCVRAAGHLKSIYALGQDVPKNPEYVAKLGELGRSEAEKLARFIPETAEERRTQNVNIMLKGIDALDKLKDKARRGDADAMHQLALLHANGRGMDKDLRRAISLWQYAALDAHPEALWELGRRYVKGEEGVAKNASLGLELLREAVGLEHTKALCMMAYRYARSGKRNRAIPMYTRAGDAFCGKALFNRGMLMKEREERLASWRDAVVAGSMEACVNLGVAHELGLQGLERDNKLALQYYEKAAATGCVKAMLNGGALMEKSNRDPKESYQGAKRLYRMAVDSGSAEAMRRLGNMMLECCEASARDKQEGETWIRKAQEIMMEQ